MSISTATVERLPWTTRLVLFPVIYFLAAWLSRWLTLGQRPFACFWLPVGWYLAVLLVHPTRRWPALVATGLAANFAFDLSDAKPVSLAAAFAVANTAEALTGAWLVRRFLPSGTSLASIHETLIFTALTALLSPTVGATIGAGSVVLLGPPSGASPALNWLLWWTASGLGVLLVAPFLLAWNSPRTATGRPLEEIALYAAVVGGAWAAVRLELLLGSGLKFLLLPLVMIWAGIRFGPRGVCLSTLVAVISIVLALERLAVGTRSVPSEFWILTAQCFGSFATFCGLMVSGLFQERRRASEELVRSEQKFSGAFHASPDPILLVDTDRNVVVEANPALARLAGRRSADLAGQTPASLDVWSQSSEWNRLLEALARSNPVHGHSCEIRTDTGEIRYCLLSAESFVLEGRPHVLVTLRDLTPQRRAEAELRASVERFRTLVENAPDGIFIVVDGRFVYANDVGYVVFGDDASDRLLGTAFEERFDPVDRPLANRHLMQVATRHRSLDATDSRCRRLDGTPFDAEWSAVSFTHEGQPAALVFLRDISGRRHLEERLRQAQKMEAIGQLAGGVAHDFNNILAAIMMHIHLLGSRPGWDEAGRQLLDELQGEASRASSLTRQLLLLGRRTAVEFRVVDLHEIIENLFKLLRRLIGEPIQLEFSARASHPVVEADPALIQQVILNLAVNSRDAMPQGGRLSLVTTDLEVTEDDLAAHPDGHPGQFVCLTVEDTGCGIPEEARQHIFEPFFTTKKVGKGTGLGLATAYGIARQHHGWLEFESDPGRQTIFRLFLPRSPRYPRPGEPEPTRTPAPGGHETILLVEDEAGVRRSVGQCLRLLGYRVLEAPTGPEALRVYDQHRGRIDLLFTDMVMPDGLTGHELALRLRARQPDLHVIISTGYSAETSTLEDSRRDGIFLLPKPYEGIKLGKTVRACLDQPLQPPHPS